ncbi:hypothetical protein H6F77_14235 [Microcoleus sp. FACHB-831]|uniref:hypothetical protein n=1 Tax=Microcoleus sp. FACHB-831 TaxID=2692827 RepID=UPI0016896E42|nr:hypothetical protein [Microcoleus sp. FACHB-831]MBD1922236.1 hypothetical protein [Microcoleus sp. FACHB-831]
MQKFYFVEAEGSGCNPSYLETMDYGDRAINRAKENQYIQEEGLAKNSPSNFASNGVKIKLLKYT